MPEEEFHDIMALFKALGAEEEIMKRLKRFLRYISGFFRRIGEDHVGAYAAQSSYFMLLSFIPFILLIMTSVKYTPLTQTMVNQWILQVIPREFQGFVQGIIDEVYTKSTAVVPISAILTLWSAGRGVQGLTNGVNCIYHVTETRNYLLSRLRSAFYTLLFILGIVLTMILLIFGNQIQEILVEHAPVIARITESIMHMRTAISLGTMCLIFLLIYKFLPNRKASFKSQLPGAVITAIAWSGFSLGFSFYVDHANSNMYGSLTTIVFIMLWMQFCMYIILIGAEINAYFEDKFRELQTTAMEHLRAEIKELTDEMDGKREEMKHHEDLF